MVMFLEHHFHIQTGELSHVTVCVGVFSTENGANLEDFLEISVDSHLFVKLRGLGEVSLGLEVIQLEHTSATLTVNKKEGGRKGSCEKIVR